METWGLRGDGALVFKGSVADGSHVKETVAAVVKEWGGVDVLVNNAGITQVLPIALVEEKDWDLVMDVNAKGAFLFSRACLKHMIKAKAGRILSIGNFASERMVEAPVHYAASKAALRGMTEALAVPGASVHLYGKLRASPGRKMGHVTALGEDADSALRTAKQAADHISFRA